MHNAEWEIAAAAAAVDHVEARIAALESEGARTAGYETVIRDGKPMRIFRMPGGFTEGGQFSRPGWSGTKSLLARFIRGLFARDHVKEHGDSWLLPRANSLAELGAPDGHPVRVRYFNDEFGVIDVKGRYSTTPTKVAWDRFSDTLPTEDQIAAVVDLPSAPDMGDDPNGTAAQRRIAEITGIYDSEHGFPDPLTEAGTPALSGVDIAAENLIGEDLSGRYIMGSNLRGASLSKSKLDRANLTDSDLTNANLVAARAVGTDFTGVDFTAAEAGYIKARDADFTGATFSVSTDFGHADLRGSRFDGNLNGLFAQANLSGADLSGVTTMPERLTGAVYDEDTVFPDGFDPEAAGMIRDIRAVPDSAFFSKDDSVARRDRFNGIEIGDRTVNVGDRWDAQGGSDAYREMFSGEVVEIVGPSSEGKGAPTLRIRRDNGEMSAVPLPNGTPVGKIETDAPGGAGHDPSLGADAPTATSAAANVYREADPQTLLRQIGNGNVLAVSGGRWTPIVDQEGRTVGVRLPVRYGYAVEARLAADDTYEVRRTFTRGATTTVKGEEAGVYAEQVGDTVYRASNFRDPFGPADDATYQILRTDGQPSLFDMVDNPGGATPTPAEELAAKINEADPASKAEAVAIDLSKAEGALKERPADDGWRISTPVRDGAPDWAGMAPVTPITVEYAAGGTDVDERNRLNQALRDAGIDPEMVRTRSAVTEGDTLSAVVSAKPDIERIDPRTGQPWTDGTPQVLSPERVAERAKATVEEAAPTVDSTPKVDGGPVGPGERIKKEGLDALAVGQAFKAQEPGRPVDYYQKVGDGLYLKSTYGFEDFPRYVSDVGGWPGWHGETIEPNIDASSLTHSITQNADGKFDVVGPDGAVLATFDTAAEAVGDWGRESRNHQLGIKTVTYRGKRYEVHPDGRVTTADLFGKKRVGGSVSEKARALAGITPDTKPALTPQGAATFRAFDAQFPVAPSETDVANNMAVLEPFARTALRQLGRDKPRRGFMGDMVDTYAPVAGSPSATPMSQKQVHAVLSALNGEIRGFAANVDAGDAAGPEFVQDRTPGGIAVIEQVDDRGRRLSSARGVTDIVALTKMFSLRESDPATTVFFAQSHHDYRGGPLPWLVSVGKADGTRATVGKLSGGKLRFADGTEVDVPGDNLRAAIDAIDAHGGFIHAPAPDVADLANVESPAALADRLYFPGDLAASKAAVADLTTRELVDAYQKLDVPDPTVRIDDAATAVASEAAARGIEMSFDADGNVYVWRAGEIDNADGVPLTAAEIDAIPRPGDTPDAGADTTIAADTVTPVTFRVQLPGGVVSRKQREGFLTGDGQNIVDADGQTLAHVENVVIDTRGEPVPAPNTPTPDATPEAPTVEPAVERPMSTREFGVMAADTLGEKRAFTFPDDRAADVERVAPHMQYGSGYIRGVMDDLAEASRAYSNGDTAEGDRLLDGVVSRVDRMTARRTPDVAPSVTPAADATAVDTPETPGINRTIATPDGVVIAQQRHVDITEPDAISGEPVPADVSASDVSDTPDVPDATLPVGSPFKTDAPKATTRNVTKALEHAGLSPARYDGRMPERQPGDVWVSPQERNAFNMQDYVAVFPHPDTAEQAASALEASGFDVKRKLDLVDASGSPQPTLYVYEKGVLGDKPEAAAPEPILSDADVAAGATIDGYSGGARRVSRTGRKYDVSETGEVTLNGKRVAGATASKVRTQASYEAAREAKAEATASARAVDLTEPIDPAAPVPEAGITVAAETIADAANEPPTPDPVDIPAGETAATVETATAGDLPEPEELPKVEPLPSGKFPPTAEQLDALVKFASGKHLVMEAGAGAGKALRDDQPVLTERGWVPIADVRVGDRVAGTDGFGWVTGVFPQGIRDTVEVVLSDGQVIVCDWDHLWDTQTEQERKRGVFTTKTTREIARTIRSRGGTRKQHYLPTVQPVKFLEADLPIDPWLLGYLLGNGSVSSGKYVVVSSQDDWALESVAAALPTPLTLTHNMGYDWRVKGAVPAPSVPGGQASPLHSSLRELGLWGIRDEDKFIPAAYLFASVDQRRALLAGLLDADGYANGRTCEIFTVSDRLAEGIRDLCNSLGWTASGATKTPTFTYRGERRVGQTGTRFYITPSRGENPFTMPRKRDAFTPRTKYPARRCIVDVRPADQAPCTCISVDTADHLYLTAGYTPTHNTASLVLLANQAKAAGRRGMFTAFNKLIVEDAAERMPDTAPALTMHSVAYRALLGSGKKWIADRLKSKGLRRIEEARILGLDRVEMPAVGGDAGETVKVGPTRLAAWVMMGLDRFAQSADTEPSIDHLVGLSGVQGRVSEADYAKLQSMAVAAMRRGWDDLTSENGKLRFKHGHYLKMFDLSKPDLGLDFIMMDEAQDTAPVMLSILRQQAERGTQIVMVGDSAQAINGFTGAVDAIGIAKQTLPDVQVSTLSQSFRFGPEIAEPANNVLAWFTPFRIAGAGNPSSVGDVPDPDAVLTRTNGTAMATAISAMEDGKTVGMSDNLRRALTEFSVGAKQLQVDGQTDQPDLAPFESWNEVLRWVEEDPAGAELKTLVGLVDRYGPDELLGYLAKVGSPGDGDLTVLTAHTCVDPLTLVETSDGLAFIRDIPDSGMIATPSGLRPYGEKVVYDPAPAVKIQTRSGFELIATPEHGVTVCDGAEERRVVAGALNIGDTLRLRIGAAASASKAVSLPVPTDGDVREVVYQTPQLLDEETAEFIGLMVADGTVWDRGFRLLKRHLDVVDRFADLCLKLFGVEATRKERVAADGVTLLPYAEVHSAFLARWLRQVGGMEPKAKAIPAAVVGSPVAVQAAFLRGLFEDGTVNVKGGKVDHIHWETRSQEMARIVQVMLLRQGIVASRTRRESQRVSSVYLYGENARLFRDRIGFISDFKQSRLHDNEYPTQRMYSIPVSVEERDMLRAGLTKSGYGNARAQGSLSRRTVQAALATPGVDAPAVAARLDWHYDRVASIEWVETTPTCITVPDGARFLQNGFDAWNSKGLQFDTVRLADDFPQLRDDNGVLQLADDDFMLMYVALTRAKKRLDPGANAWITEPPPGETVRPAPRAQIAEGFSIPDEVQSWLDVWLDTPEEVKSNGRGDGWVSGHAGLVGQTNVAPGRQTWMRKVTGKGGGAGRVSPKNSEFVDNAIDSEKAGDGWRITPHFPGDGLYEIQTEHTTRSGERKTERQLIVVKDGVAAHPDYTSMDRAAAEGRDWWDPQNIDLLDTPVEVVDVPLDGAPSTPGTTPDPVTAPERVGPYADLLNRYTSKLVDSDVENDPALKTQASEVLAAMAEADAFDSDFLESVWTKAANKLRRDQRDWDGQADPDGPRPELVDLSTKQARAVLNSARRWMETQSNPDGPPEPAAEAALLGAPVDGVADVEPPADITRPWRVDQIRAAVSRGHTDLTAAQINTADPVVATTYGERQRDGSIRVTATPGLLVDGDFYPAAEPTVVERIPKFGGGKELAKWLGRQKLTDGVSVHDMGDAKPLADRTVSELLGTTYSVEDVAKLLRRGGLTEQQRAELRNILEQLGGVVAALTTPEAAMPVDVEYPGGAVLLARVRPNISNDAEPHLAALSECDNETTLLINDEPVAAWVPGVVPTRDEVEAVVAALGWRFDSEDAWTLAAAPPAERCRVAGVSPTWLVAADNYLSRLGVRRGEAVPVRWGDDTVGLIDADDDGTIKQVPVSWERFSDDVPTADMQFVDTPHIVKNRTATESGRGRRCAERIRDAGIGYASVADKYLGKWGIFKGDTVPVRWLDDDTALVLAIDGQPIKAAWSRFSDDDPNEMNVADLDLVDGSAYQDMPPGAVFAVEAFGRPVSTPDGRTAAFVKNADGSFSQADSPVVAWQWDPRVGAHLQLLVAVEAEES